MAIVEVLRRTLVDPDELYLLRTGVLKPKLAKIRKQGYASSTGQNRNINALAVPIKANEAVLGSLSLRYFASALRPRDAVDKFFKPLRQGAEDITKSLN